MQNAKYDQRSNNTHTSRPLTEYLADLISFSHIPQMRSLLRKRLSEAAESQDRKCVNHLMRWCNVSPHLLHR